MRAVKEACSAGPSAAFEFALVAPVFMAIPLAILETAIMFFADQILETAAQNSPRPDHNNLRAANSSPVAVIVGG